ncbi:family 10 glycosylhydrolase [bacterium]|nr:family 10 glycosylhydrolase [bacterium]
MHTSRIPVIVLLLLLPAAAALHAQQARRELRGAWVTTLLGLDWPASSLRGNPEAQQQALREIFDDLQSQHFNAVFFQVRSRGNAMYRSALEPWASELTGTLGRNPGWDPLAFAIREAHARGMELHAWFNVCRVWSAGMPPACSPEHIVRAHPQWVQRFGDDMWMDAGIPAARDYTLRVLEDLVRKYPIDGIHFDYVRYPDRGFRDDDTYRRYGRGMQRDDWRRENVNTIVREAYRKLTRLRPALQVGSAPIGIYRNIPGAKGWEGRNAIYQDSRRWLQDGYSDYVVPQIYWGLRRHGSRIDFEALVDDWKQGASGRHVYAGVAAYKDAIQPWLQDHVDATRDHGADGIVFFRYEHIRGRGFAGRFRDLAIPPPMPWRDNIRPNPPLHVRLNDDMLVWDAPVPASDGDSASWYGLYGWQGEEKNSATLLALLPAWARSAQLPDGYDNAGVTALDAFYNESGLAVELPPIAEAEEVSAPSITMPGPRISTPQYAGSDHILLAFELWRPADVRIRLMDSNGAEAMVLVDGRQSAGTHIIGIQTSRLPEDVQRYIFEADGMRSIMDFQPGSSVQ